MLHDVYEGGDQLDNSLAISSLYKRRDKLENVPIANALQLEAARAIPALSRFNYDAMPIKFDVAEPSIALLWRFCC